MKTAFTLPNELLYMPEELAKEIDARFGKRIAAAGDDVAEIAAAMDSAWRYYLANIYRFTSGNYDPVSGKHFGNKMFSPASLMYKHYFGQLPPVKQREILDHTLAEHGIESLSRVMDTWLKNKYNPRNIYGMVGKVKQDSKEYPVFTSVPELFQYDEENEDEE